MVRIENPSLKLNGKTYVLFSKKGEELAMVGAGHPFNLIVAVLILCVKYVGRAGLFKIILT